MASTAEVDRVHIKKAKAEIARLSSCGENVELVNEDVQPYILVRGIDAPHPPWNQSSYDILIALPVAYDHGTGLDAFYLKLPYQFSNGPHARISGPIIPLLDERWQLVSWHYPDGRQFQVDNDSIESHIVHCKGFFWERKAVNARG
jgi:hypothetical protein